MSAPENYDWLLTLCFVVLLCAMFTHCASYAEPYDYRMDLAITRQLEAMSQDDIHALAGAQASPPPQPVACYQLRKFESETGPAEVCITELQWLRLHEGER